MTDTFSLANTLVEKAAATIASEVETAYVHTPEIDVEAGIYSVDCSGFLSFLIGAVAERHYEMIAATTTDKRPLARDFYGFRRPADHDRAGLAPGGPPGGHRAG